MRGGEDSIKCVEDVDRTVEEFRQAGFLLVKVSFQCCLQELFISTGISSHLGAKLRDLAVRPASAGCNS